MYKVKKLFFKIFTIFTFLFFVSNVFAQSQTKHQSVTDEIIKIVDSNPEIKTLIIKSIESAKKANPDINTNPAQTLEKWYAYLDWSLTAMPWRGLRNVHYPSIFDELFQSINYFYFVLDQPLKELENKGLYYNSLQYYEPVRSWVKKYIQQYGDHLNTKSSWNKDYYNKIYADKNFGLQNDWYENPNKWTTFNDFFSRKLKSPEARPIAGKDDDSVVVSPVDSVPQGIWNIDDKSNIVQKNGVRIKSSIYYSVSKILGEDSAYKDAFANGYFTHTFLNVHDYHRYHFAVSGIVKEVRVISQDNDMGGHIYWDKSIKRYVLDSRVPGWQSIETRGVVIVETKEYGLVALLPMGMAEVNSVNFEDNVKVGKYFSKGDPLGYFLFGGSDFIMMFQKDSGFAMTTPKEKDGKYKHILMGEKYGTFNKK